MAEAADVKNLNLKVSWGGKKFDVEFDVCQGLAMFKGVIFSLTQVPPDKQKIIRRKVNIDSDEALAGLKDKSRLKLIGSAESAPVKGDVEVVFAEDLSLTERAKLGDAMPPGLENLGNTCYLNATVQCLHGIPALSGALQEFSNESLDPSVSKALGQLFHKMSRTKESFQPFGFVQFFRQALPRFAQLDDNRRGYIQQDAGEFLIELLTKIKSDGVGGDIITKLFEFELERTDTCTESEEVQHLTDQSTRLICRVNKNVSHLIFGLKEDMDSELEKNSPELGRSVIWKRADRVKSLPEILCIDISRFQWKETSDGGINCKQLRRVAFPHKLDLSMICCEELKARLMKFRQEKLDWEDEMREKRQSAGLGLENEVKKDAKGDKRDDSAPAKKNEAMQEEVVEAAPTPAPAAAASEEPADAMEVEETANEEASPDEKMETEKPPNESGEYELIGVVTHKGRGANSGHYIGYSKNLKTKRWMKFDDEDVYEVKDEDIEALYGGGDFQMGYICFYKKIPATELTPYIEELN